MYKAEKPSIHLSVRLSRRLGLPVSTHQVLNIKRSSSAYTKFVTTRFTHASVCPAKQVEGEGVEKTWVTFLSKLQVVNHLICKRKVVGLNPAAGTFFLEIIPFGHTFLLSTFETAIIWHPYHLWRWDSSKIKHPSSGNSNIVVVYQYLLLSVLYRTLKALV